MGAFRTGAQVLARSRSRNSGAPARAIVGDEDKRPGSTYVNDLVLPGRQRRISWSEWLSPEYAPLCFLDNMVRAAADLRRLVVAIFRDGPLEAASAWQADEGSTLARILRVEPSLTAGKVG